MEAALLALFAAGVVLASPVIAIIAFVRSTKIAGLQRSVADLEARIDDLRRAVRSVQPSAGEARPAPHPAPAPEAVAAPVIAPAPAPTPPTPVVSAPAPARVPPVPPLPPPPVMRAPEIPAPPPKPPIEWERWIGIRGAAVLGAIVLAIAGLLFFQYSIQHGLITPTMRVVTGIVVGLACLVGSEWLRRRDYRATPEGLSGAGIVVLYAAFWAAHALYRLVPLAIPFALMALVTVACGLLAIRHASRLVAALGLIGGFATPLLLRSDADRPIGLFGYVLLLDLGLIAVGHRKRWPWLGALALAGTVLIQGLWVGTRMGPDRVVLGLAILGVFAILFAAAGFFAKPGDRAGWRIGQAGGLLLPFAFAIYFAARIDLGPHLWPVAIFLLLLCGGASWVARQSVAPWLGLAAAAGAVAVFGVWRLQAPETTAAAWESVAIAAALAALFHIFVEIDRERAGLEGPAPAALAAAGGFFVALLVASAISQTVAPWPWIAGWIALAALLYRHATFPERGALQIAAALGVALGTALQHRMHAREAAFPAPGRFLAVVVGIAIAAQIVALVRRSEPARALANHAAATFAAVFALSLAGSRLLPELGAGLALGASTVLGLLVVLAASRLPEARWSLAALAVTAIAHIAWVEGRPGLLETAGPARGALGLALASAALFTAWPFVAGPAYRSSRFAWYAAALAGPAWFFTARSLWLAAFGDARIGLLPILLGALALAGLCGARRAAIADERVRLSALVWLAAVAICSASVAIPLQLEKSWITIGWALEGLALVLLWVRLDHPGLKWFALAHLGAATVRLVPTLVVGYHARSSLPIVNWVLYTYLVPAAALLASARILAPRETRRARSWESSLYARGWPLGAMAAAIAAILVVFVWINLAIADWFTEGERLALDFGRSPARDLTVSIAWAIYALVLLGFGMARASGGLRWISLGFLVVTIGKVFLYDLGELRDLYRVVSLVGLAVSLLSVSLLYQRFVFRKKPGESP